MATFTNNLDNITVHWDNDDSDHDNDGDTTGQTFQMFNTKILQLCTINILSEVILQKILKMLISNTHD